MMEWIPCTECIYVNEYCEGNVVREIGWEI